MGAAILLLPGTEELFHLHHAGRPTQVAAPELQAEAEKMLHGSTGIQFKPAHPSLGLQFKRFSRHGSGQQTLPIRRIE